MPPDGGVEVSAENGAKIHSTVATASVSVAIGGTNGISFSGGGAVALNNIATDTNAFIEASSITEADSVSVTAKASSTIKAETLAISLSIGVGGTVGGAASFGAAVAINEIGHGEADRDQVQAYVRGSSIEATGALTVDATSTETIDALVAAGSAAIGAGTTGVGISGAGAGARNTIAVRTAAFLDDPDDKTGSIITVGSAAIGATDTSPSQQIVGAASLAAGFGATGVAITIGISIALNDIHNETYAGVLDGQVLTSTSGGLSVKATQGATIDALSAAASSGRRPPAPPALRFRAQARWPRTPSTTTPSPPSSAARWTAPARSPWKRSRPPPSPRRSPRCRSPSALGAGPGVGAAIGVSVAINQIGNWTVPDNPDKDGKPIRPWRRPSTPPQRRRQRHDHRKRRDGRQHAHGSRQGRPDHQCAGDRRAPWRSAPVPSASASRAPASTPKT